MQILFASLHQLVTKNQMRNTKFICFGFGCNCNLKRDEATQGTLTTKTNPFFSSYRVKTENWIDFILFHM